MVHIRVPLDGVGLVILVICEPGALLLMAKHEHELLAHFIEEVQKLAGALLTRPGRHVVQLDRFWIFAGRATWTCEISSLKKLISVVLHSNISNSEQLATTMHANEE